MADVDVGTLAGDVQIDDEASKVFDAIVDSVDKAGKALDAFADKLGNIDSETAKFKSGQEDAHNSVQEKTRETSIEVETLQDKIIHAFEDPIGTIQAFGHELQVSILENMNAIGLGAAAVIAAFTGMTLAVKELGEQGSKVNDVKETFDHLSDAIGQTGEELLGGLREGVLGTISDFDLMASTNKLLGTGIRLTADDMTTLGETAHLLGERTGTDASGGLSLLSNALTTGRTRALAMAGILVDTKKAEQEFADQLGVTVEQLNREGKLHADRIAILEAARKKVEQMGGAQKDFGDIIEAGIAGLVNWGNNLAGAVAKSPIVMKALTDIADAIQTAFGATSQGLMDSIVHGVEAFASGVSAALPYVVSFVGGIGDALKWLRDIDAEFGISESGLKLLKEAFTGTVAGITAVVDGIEGLAKWIVDLPGWVKDLGEALVIGTAAAFGLAKGIEAIQVAIGTITILKELVAGIKFGAMAELFELMMAQAAAGGSISVMGLLSTAISNLGTSLYALLGPIGIATAAIAALTFAAKEMLQLDFVKDFATWASTSDSLAASLVRYAQGWQYVSEEQAKAAKVSQDSVPAFVGPVEDYGKALDAIVKGGNIDDLVRITTELADAGMLGAKQFQEIANKAKAFAAAGGELPPILQNIVNAQAIMNKQSEDQNYLNGKLAESEKTLAQAMEERAKRGIIATEDGIQKEMDLLDLSYQTKQGLLSKEIAAAQAARDVDSGKIAELQAKQLVDFEKYQTDKVALQQKYDKILEDIHRKSADAIVAADADFAKTLEGQLDAINRSEQNAQDAVVKQIGYTSDLWSAQYDIFLEFQAKREAKVAEFDKKERDAEQALQDEIGKLRITAANTGVDTTQQMLDQQEQIEIRHMQDQFTREEDQQAQLALIYEKYGLLKANAGAEQMKKATDDLQKYIEESTLTTTDYQIAQIDRWVQAQMDAYKGNDAEAYYAKIKALADKQVDDLYIDGKAIRDNSYETLNDAAAKAQTTYDYMKAHSEDFSAATIEHFRKIAEAANEAAAGAQNAWSHVGDNLMNVLKGVPQTIVQAVTGGGGLFGAIEGISSQVGSVLGEGVGKSISSAVTGLGSLAGPIGSAIGSLAGPLIGMIHDLFARPEFKNVAADVGRDFGTTISENLAKAIAETEKVEGLERIQAVTLHLMDVINEAGGLTSKNVEEFTGKLRDSFVYLTDGSMTLKQATETIDSTWQAFVTQAVEGDGLISASLKEIEQLAEDNGVKSKEMMDYIKGQAESAASGLTDMFKAIAGPAGEAKDGIDAVGNSITLTQTQAEGLGAAFAATFAQIIAQGGSLTDAINAVKDGMGAAEEAFTKAGVSGGAAFDEMKTLVDAASDSVTGPLIAGISGADQALKGLSNSNLLTQQSFDGIVTTTSEMIKKLQDAGLQGAALGAVMDPTLQTIYELQQQFGYSVDSTTQSLIDQEVAAGRLGETHKSAQQQMIDGVNRIAAATEGLAKVFGVELPDAVTAGTGAITTAMDGVTQKTTDVQSKVGDLQTTVADPTAWQGMAGAATDAATVANDQMQLILNTSSMSSDQIEGNYTNCWTGVSDQAQSALTAVVDQLNAVAEASGADTGDIVYDWQTQWTAIGEDTTTKINNMADELVRLTGVNHDQAVQLATQWGTAFSSAATSANTGVNVMIANLQTLPGVTKDVASGMYNEFANTMQNSALTTDQKIDTISKRIQTLTGVNKDVADALARQFQVAFDDMQSNANTGTTNIGNFFQNLRTRNSGFTGGIYNDWIQTLTGMQQNASIAASNMYYSLSSVRPPTVYIPVTYYATNNPSNAATGGLVTAAGVEYLAAGGPVDPMANMGDFWGSPRGTDTVKAWLTPGEGVVTTTGMDVLGADGLSALNRGENPFPPEQQQQSLPPITINVMMPNGQVLTSAYLDELDSGGILRGRFDRMVERKVRTMA